MTDAHRAAVGTARLAANRIFAAYGSRGDIAAIAWTFGRPGCISYSWPVSHAGRTPNPPGERAERAAWMIAWDLSICLSSQPAPQEGGRVEDTRNKKNS